MLGFCGVVLFVGVMGSVDIDAMTFREAAKYIFAACLILFVAFIGTVSVEVLQSERISPDSLPDGWALLDLYPDEPDVCVRAGCPNDDGEKVLERRSGITVESLKMCPFGMTFEPAERVITPDEEHTEAYTGGERN